MSKRIIIVGGGVIGLCTALYASRRGDEVVIIDRKGPEHPGASFINAGLVTPSHFVPLAAPGTLKLALKWMLSPESPFYVKPRLDRDLMEWGWRFMRAATAENVARSAPTLGKLLVESHTEFEKLAEEWDNDFGFVRRGVLMVCKTEKYLASEAAAAERGRAIGIPGQLLTAAQLAELEPDVRLDVAGAVLYPQDSHLSPDAFMKSVRTRLGEREIDMRWNTEVTGWRTGADTVEAVVTPAGELRGDEYVVCGGAWSPSVVRDLGIRLPLQAGKGYSLTLPRPRQKPTRPLILMEARVAVTPIGETLRVGGTMEIAGDDDRINPARIRGILKSLPRYLPDFGADDFKDVAPAFGHRPCSPDGLPYIGRFEKFRNLLAATGHAMVGVSLGPVTGKLVMEVIHGEVPSVSLERLSPDRFGR